MILESPDNLNSLARSLALLGATNGHESIPRDFLNLDGFNLMRPQRESLELYSWALCLPGAIIRLDFALD